MLFGISISLPFGMIKTDVHISTFDIFMSSYIWHIWAESEAYGQIKETELTSHWYPQLFEHIRPSLVLDSAGLFHSVGKY